MAGEPTFLGPDGQYRSEFIFTTDLEYRFFVGQCPADTAYMQISVRGGPMLDDPDLITFEGDSFIIPNPVKYPNGHRLSPGGNLIEVRAIRTSGAITPTASIQATLAQDEEVFVQAAPTGLRVDRENGFIRIVIDEIQSGGDAYFQGFNVYASADPGGLTGYVKLNPTALTDLYRTEETVTPLTEMQTDASVSLDGNGAPLADPLYFRVTGQQEGRDGSTIQLDINERVAVTEVTRHLRTTVILESVTKRNYYSFEHQRDATYTTPGRTTIPNSILAGTPTSDDLYYVVTAVYYDSGVMRESESPYSVEVTGKPLLVTPLVGTFPPTSRRRILNELTQAIHRSNPHVAVQPGSVLRDVFIDPMSSESQRLRFILEFLHAAQSFSTLLAIDDPTNAGVSIDTSYSSYKQALGQAFYLSNTTEVQALIDMCFDKLAHNLGITRRFGTRARGVITFYTTSRPTTTINVPIGTPVLGNSRTFKTTSVARIPVTLSAQYYDSSTGTYRVQAYVRDSLPGASGNLSASQLTSVTLTGVSGLQATNEASCYGGLDRENNTALAIRAMAALASVDSGTLRGYEQTVATMAGVIESKVIVAGDSLMKRDYDYVLGQNRGGKIDIYVRGLQLSTVTDTFAFSFEMAYDTVFEPVGDPQDLIFQAQDQTLSEDNPIIEVLDFPDRDPPLGVRNASTGDLFVLEDLEILSYDTIQLSSEFNDPADIDVTDVIMGDYRYRTSLKFVPTRQPVEYMVTMQGSEGTIIAANEYTLYRLDDPLVLGRSSAAENYVQVSSDTNIGTILEVEDEEHILIGDNIEYLFMLGANKLTISVKDSEGTAYNGPEASAPDYRIISPEDDQTPFAIQLTENSTISSGEAIYIDYTHDENFTIQYVSNSLIGTTQDSLESDRHLTADIIVKEATKTSVDISATIVMVAGADVEKVEKDVRNRLVNHFNTLKMGMALRHSDVLESIDASAGVSYVVVPLTRLARQEGALVIRESLDTSESDDLLFIEEWSSDLVHSYLILEPLSSATINGGGEGNEYRAVQQEGLDLMLETIIPNEAGQPLQKSVGKCFVIGNGGLTIPGYNDDDTVAAAYPKMDQNERYEQSMTMTQNRVLVTVAASDSPTNHTYEVTYYVGDDQGVGNIEPEAIEYLTAGNFEFIFDEDTPRVTSRSSYTRVSGSSY